jgi:hypothetical protein
MDICKYGLEVFGAQNNRIGRRLGKRVVVVVLAKSNHCLLPLSRPVASMARSGSAGAQPSLFSCCLDIGYIHVDNVQNSATQ